MPKIDCSVTVNFLRERQRMCDSNQHGCSNCALREASRYTEHTCSDYTYICPEEAIEIVQKWSDEHPVKTRLEDLLEKYPNMQFGCDGLPEFFPSGLGYCENCMTCRCFENLKSRVCWNEPLEGGATGKAVE